MPIGKTLVLVDGENLSSRYKQMIADGRAAATGNVVVGDFFVWNPDVLGGWLWDILRISYHTSVVGDQAALDAARGAISAVRFKCRAEVIALYQKTQMFRTAEGRLVPQVRKRASKTRKESICDTAISVEALRAAYRDQAQKIVLLSGDGDFIPLYQELMHSGCEVVVGAFSSGLNQEVPLVVDSFFNLDEYYFQK
ncbi:NYN domain-containing protein [Arenimonas sp.]|uniref:NYN domain-containing protein n=1 Tax=Arenimonas sp. TaxID=1872635 RepID=UPI0025C2E813|nr:NYN domain-containing protein [Arenimonas sp.]